MTPQFIKIYAKNNGQSKERDYIIPTGTISCIENAYKADGSPLIKIRASAGTFVMEGTATVNQHGELIINSK